MGLHAKRDGIADGARRPPENSFLPNQPTSVIPTSGPHFFQWQDDKLVFSTSSALRARILMVNAVPDNDLWNR